MTAVDSPGIPLHEARLSKRDKNRAKMGYQSRGF